MWNMPSDLEDIPSVKHTVLTLLFLVGDGYKLILPISFRVTSLTQCHSASEVTLKNMGVRFPNNPEKYGYMEITCLTMTLAAGRVVPLHLKLYLWGTGKRFSMSNMASDLEDIPQVKYMVYTLLCLVVVEYQLILLIFFKVTTLAPIIWLPQCQWNKHEKIWVHDSKATVKNDGTWFTCVHQKL